MTLPPQSPAGDVADFTATINRLAALWQEPTLAAVVRVHWSTRLRTALGLCRPATGRVVLNALQLANTPALLHEVLCHELAHVVVYRRHGRRAVAHGPEWQALVRAAGYTPSTTLPTQGPPLSSPTRPRPRPLVLHRCPVCHTQRVARRAVPQWRCAECHAAGLPGILEISRMSAPE